MRFGAVLITVVLLVSDSPLIAQATKPAAPAANAADFNVGAKVEVKWGGLWRDAIVKNRGNGWVLVNYSPGSSMEWVEPWRIRAAGSKDESIEYAKPGRALTKAEPPPMGKPGAPPERGKPAP